MMSNGNSMLGIYGGTFNPVHYGHLRTAIEVKEAFNLEQLRLMPCFLPALKTEPCVSAKMRLEMLELAIANEPDLVCDDRELQREGYSYMVDTLVSLKQDFPEQTLILFIGMDAFLGLTSWYQWQHLFDNAHLVVMTRPQFNQPVLNEFLHERICEKKTDLNDLSSGKIYFQTVTHLAISSTFIRQLHSQEKNLRFLLPDDVIDYMIKNQLYRNLNANP